MVNIKSSEFLTIVIADMDSTSLFSNRVPLEQSKKSKRKQKVCCFALILSPISNYQNDLVDDELEQQPEKRPKLEQDVDTSNRNKRILKIGLLGHLMRAKDALIKERNDINVCYSPFEKYI